MPTPSIRSSSPATDAHQSGIASRRLLCIAAIAATLLVGCPKPEPTPPPIKIPAPILEDDSPSPPTVSTSDAKSDSSPNDNEEFDSDDRDQMDGADHPDDISPVAVPTIADQFPFTLDSLRTGHAESRWDHRRYALILPDGPVLLDMILQCDGRALSLAQTDAATDVFNTFAAADSSHQSSVGDMSTALAETISAEIDSAESIPAEPSSDEPSPDEPSPDEPSPDEPSPDEPSPDELSPDESSPDESSPDESSADEASPELSASENSPPDSVAPDDSAPNDATTISEAERTLWTKILASEYFRNELLPNLQSSDDDSIEQIIELYDENKDGFVDPLEFVAWLSRGLTSRELIQSSEANEHRFANRDSSLVLSQIDSNSDGELSVAELDTASIRLRLLDRNNDFLVSFDEVRPDAMDQDRSLNQQRVDLSPALIDLSDPDSDRLFRRRIEDEYGSMTGFQTGCFPMRPGLFAALDNDNDSVLQPDEILSFPTLDSELLIVVDFPSAATVPEQQQYETQATGQTTDDELDSTMAKTATVEAFASFDESDRYLVVNRDERSQDSPVLQLGNVAIQTLTLDPLAANDQRRLVSGIASQLGVTATSEGSASGQVAAFGRFGSAGCFDLNSDESISLYEIKKFVSTLDRLTDGLCRIRLYDPEDAWFELLDTDGNGVLTELEIQQIAERIQGIGSEPLDSIYPSQLPLPMTLIISRMAAATDPFSGQNISTIQRRQNGRTSVALPNWFQAMDSNDDNFVARREFLGDQSSFEKFDANADGIITTAELSN